MKNTYLERYAYPGLILEKSPSPEAGIIIVIPCYNEPNIIDALESINICQLPDCDIEVISVVNHSEHDEEKIKNRNHQSIEEIKSWVDQKTLANFHVIEALDLPGKKASVGLARKIGMDEAARRFESIGKQDGIILCYDADCTCTPNYLTELYKAYSEDCNANAGITHFEHQIDLGSNENNAAIINYELHLRYYVNALKYAQFPFAYQTIGSCISVRSDIYQKQGGMNQRKAGEDFYFLQRLFPLGGIIEINKATVFPSSRKSDRVPFGTGKAVGEILASQSSKYFTYNPAIFRDFRFFNVELISIWECNFQTFFKSMPTSVQAFLEESEFEKSVTKIVTNSTGYNNFRKSFYNWFNGFKAMKYVHFARDQFYSNIEIEDATQWLAKELLHTSFDQKAKIDMLKTWRKYDKSQ